MTPRVPGLPPKPPKLYLAPLNRLQKRIPGLQALFHDGHVRTITTDRTSVLYDAPMVLGKPVQQARSFLNVPEIYSALGLRNHDLQKATVEEGPLGYRVTFTQELTTQEGRRIRVRAGFVDVHMDRNGKVFSVNSTLRYGRRRVNLDDIHSEEEAISQAKAHLQHNEPLKSASSYSSEQAELVFSAHNGNLDPVYEVILTSNEPTHGHLGRSAVMLLVKAKTLEVVDVRDLIKRGGCINQPLVEQAPVFATRKKPAATPRAGKKPGMQAGNQALGNVLLQVPTPNKPIAQQFKAMPIPDLPDPKTLVNSRIALYTSNNRAPVKAKSDGSYLYNGTDPENSATVTYFGINEQLELFSKWGLKPQKRGRLTIRVEDRSGRDNAYYDEAAYLIAILVGSGVHIGGLTRYIAHDIGVAWHENGHHIADLQTPNGLSGPEGDAANEGLVADSVALLMDWWFRFHYASQIGVQLTVADIVADPRIIGAYAAPPRGIRIQNNKKRTPRDKTGEPHNDGMIIGGAATDAMVAMVQQANDIPSGLESFGRLLLAALSVVPSHKVTFRDMLTAFLTADQVLNNSANKALITKAFADHGITLTSNSRGNNMPVIVVTS